MIIVENKKKKKEEIEKKYPGAEIIDVTSKSEDDFVKLSPFYPHYGIPVPFSGQWTAACVEDIWQGLKVFESSDIDIDLLKNDSMKNIKRTVRSFGKMLGHRKGVRGKELLSYIDARKEIYLPAYKWMLEHRVVRLMKELIKLSKKNDVVLLDYNTNCDVEDLKKPLSHAGLIKAYIEGNYPE